MLGTADQSRARQFNYAIVGIGNCLNGDDAAGCELATRLQEEHRREPFPANVLILNGGTAPENFSGVLRRFGPDRVLLVDAAEMGEEAGTMRGLDWRDAHGFGPSTHLQPIATLGEYLEAELGCEVALLGIQPRQLDFDAPLSMAVDAAVRELVTCIGSLLRWG